MFTGIVREEGEVLDARTSDDGAVFVIGCGQVVSDLGIGDSISVNGCCLTVVSRDESSFTVEATPETLRLTNLGSLRLGTRVNLEPAAKLTDFLGGHLVQGHVDDKGRVVSITDEGNSQIFRFAASEKVLRYCTYKGSITVNGVSLTVTRSDNEAFEVAIIPHTLEVTNFSSLRPGDEVNLEADIISKYVESHVLRLMTTGVLLCLLSLGQLLAGDIRLSSGSMLIYENETKVKTSQFVIRIGRYEPDIVLEWESEKDQGTVHLYESAVEGGSKFTINQLYDVGVHSESRDQMTIQLSRQLFRELLERKTVKLYLNKSQVKFRLAGEGVASLKLDGTPQELPVIRVEDSQSGAWAILRDPDSPLVLEYSTPHFHQRLVSISSTSGIGLRWLKKLPPIQ